MALLAGCGTGINRGQPVDAVADGTSSEAVVVTLAPTAMSVPEKEVASDQLPVIDANLDNSAIEATDNGSADSGDLQPISVGPEVGEITFALGATEEYEPISPSIFFTKGITQVHAIFAYSGMSSKYTWERVWYLNDQEVARGLDLWSGSDAGVFDYFIDNGGEPLPAGDWVLELYVEGKLTSMGVFIIE
jgi:hypothetical protein